MSRRKTIKRSILISSFAILWMFSATVAMGEIKPPRVVDASDGLFANRVLVRWTAVPDANQYRVYRAESISDPRTPLGGWRVRRVLNDIRAEQGKTYYYWIKARNATEVSRFSHPDEGWLLSTPAPATNPDPADGSNAGPEYWPPNVYMMLDYTPGENAVTHTAYFSDVEQDVIDRNPAKSLGSTPPWPAVDDNAFVVGYDDAAIEEYARAPLVTGRTYYWCIDENDGTDDWFGTVWSFTVMPPQAWGPTPADDADLVLTDMTLSWNLGDLETDGYLVRYLLYVGTNEAALEAIATGDTDSPEYVATVEPNSYEIADLEPDTEHFWRVDTKLTSALPPFLITIIPGDVWTFTTGP